MITDAKRVSQLIFILLFNAIKYTSEGYVNLKANYIRIDQNKILELQVLDSGCGMHQSVINNLFSLFRNLKNKQSVNQHGIGLGLTIAYQIIKSLKGDIKVKSCPNSGT